jgi:hypothetical protein
MANLFFLNLKNPFCWIRRPALFFVAKKKKKKKHCHSPTNSVEEDKL